MKKILSILCVLALLLCITGIFSGCGKQVKTEAKIGVLQFDRSETTTALIDGYKDSLNSRYDEGAVEYVERDAEGDADKLIGYIQELVDEGVNAIVTVGDEASIAAVEQGLSVPVFFLGVTDAVGEGLTDSLDAPNKNATGTESVAPTEKLLEQMGKLTPLTSASVIYNGNDAGATHTAMLLAANSAIAFTLVSVSTEDEAVNAASAVSQDAIILTDDSLVDGAAEKIAAVAKEIPVFGFTEAVAQFGGVMSVVSDVRELGGLTGQMTYSALNGTPISELSVLTAVSGNQTYINQAKALQLGYTLSDEFLNTAMLVHKVTVTEAPAEEETAE